METDTLRERTKWVEPLYPGVLQHAKKIWLPGGVSPQETADVVQNCIASTLAAFSREGRSPPDTKLEQFAYLRVTVTNSIRRGRRKRARERTGEVIVSCFSVVSVSDQIAVENEEKEQIASALRAIPGDEAVAVVLHVVAGWPLARVGLALGCGKYAAARRTRRGIQALKLFFGVPA